MAYSLHNFWRGEFKMTKRELLIVDDDDAFLFAFKRLFEKRGFIIDFSTTVDDGIYRIEKKDYPLIITDLEFNKDLSKEGFKIITHAKNKNPKVKTILLTAYGNKMIEEKARELGVDLCLTKPVRSETIKEAMKSVGFI